MPLKLAIEAGLSADLPGRIGRSGDASTGANFPVATLEER
jgi:hypothetical protein